MSTIIKGYDYHTIIIQGEINQEIFVKQNNGLLLCSDQTVIGFEYNKGNWKFVCYYEGTLFDRISCGIVTFKDGLQTVTLQYKDSQLL